MTMTVNVSDLIGSLSATTAQLSNRAPFIAQAAMIVNASTRARIEMTKKSPDGSAWAPWAKGTASQRKRRGTAGRGLLNDSGSLLNSINSKTSALGMEVSADSPHAGFLQNGTRHMSAREFMGISRADSERIDTALEAWVLRSLK